MKKILLGTTGLVGAALLATAASAETPKVTLGGFSNFEAGWVDNDIDAGTRSVGFRNDNQVSVRVDGKTDSGLGYGAVIDLEADITASNSGQGINADRTFTYLEGSWGRAEMGGNKSAAATMRVDASTLAVATGGINGDWKYFVDPSGATQAAAATASLGSSQGFITNSKLPTEHGLTTSIGGDNTEYNATKITYYTPRFSGFQAGVSYTPDTNSTGQFATRVDTGAGQGFGNVWDAGLSYAGEWSGVKTAISATGEWAEGDNTTIVAGTNNGSADVRAWNVGALLGWQGFSVAGSWGDWNKAGMTTAADGDAEGRYWTAGLGYDAGAIGLSATYLDSRLDDGLAGGRNNFRNLVLGADYKLAPGLTPYAEVSFYDFDPSGATVTAGTPSNTGTEVLLGTNVAF